MELSVREAATLLGRSPRTVRSQLLRGDLPGKKRGGRWRIERRDLPLTERQRRALNEKADAIRRTVESALPSRTAVTSDRRGRSLADLEAFQRTACLAGEIRRAGDDQIDPALRHRLDRLLGAAVLAIAEAVHQYEPDVKLEAVRRARRALAHAVALLLAEEPDAPPAEPHLGWIVRLESEVLPAVAGFARWIDGLPRRER